MNPPRSIVADPPDDLIWEDMGYLSELYEDDVEQQGPDENDYDAIADYASGG